mgnify:CR=1 FL=1
MRPLGRIQVDYEDPHDSAPDPNLMFPLMFQSLVTSLSGGGHSPVNEFPPAQAAERFNAQWASASVFDVADEFAPSHGQTLLVAMHRNQLADGYAVFLFDDYAAARPLIDADLGTLSFKPRRGIRTPAVIRVGDRRACREPADRSSPGRSKPCPRRSPLPAPTPRGSTGRLERVHHEPAAARRPRPPGSGKTAWRPSWQG